MILIKTKRNKKREVMYSIYERIQFKSLKRSRYQHKEIMITFNKTTALSKNYNPLPGCKNFCPAIAYKLQLVIIHTSISFNSVIVELLSTEICESIRLDSLTCHAVNNAVPAWVHVPHDHAHRIYRKD